MIHKLNSRMQFLLDRLTSDRVRPKDRFKYIKTKEFKAKCKVYKYRFSDRDIKTLYTLNCFTVSSLQLETEPKPEADVSETYQIYTATPIITTYSVTKPLINTEIEPPPNSISEFEIGSEAPLVNTHKITQEIESAPQSFLEFDPNIYTLCSIYLLTIAAIVYFFYVVFYNPL